MATTYTQLPEYEFLGGSSSRVGYGNSTERIVRYKFTTPPEGANKFSFTKGSIGLAEGKESALRFFISTDPDLYDTLTTEFDGHGLTSITGNNASYYTVSGNIDGLILLPDTDYYLYVFPDTTTMCMYSWNYAATITVTLDGGAGLVRLDTGSGFVNAIPHIDNGTEWNHAIPYCDSSTVWGISG